MTKSMTPLQRAHLGVGGQPCSSSILWSAEASTSSQGRLWDRQDQELGV